MTLKFFLQRVEETGGSYQQKDNGTITYSGKCSQCGCDYTILMATVVLQTQLSTKGQYAPRCYLRCNTCVPLPNRVTLERKENAA